MAATISERAAPVPQEKGRPGSSTLSPEEREACNKRCEAMPGFAQLGCFAGCNYSPPPQQ